MINHTTNTINTMLHPNQGQAPTKNEQTITSLEIAEITGKNHRDILRSIRDQEVAWENINERRFALVEYIDNKGEKRPMYNLTKMESLYIISKYDDETRARLVKRWYDLETGAPAAQKLEPKAQIQQAIDRYWVQGDNTRVAERLGLSPEHVSKVKRGLEQSARVTEALLDQCIYNKENGLDKAGITPAIQMKLDALNGVDGPYAGKSVMGVYKQL